MGNILVTVQLLGSFVAFALIILVYRAKSSEPQKVLLAGTIFVYINMLGYYFELTSKTVETAILGIKMEYIGNTLGSLLFIFFVCIYSPQKSYRFWKIFYLINNLFILFLVLTYPNHTLYYKGISMRIGGGITYVDMEYGIFYYWWVISSSVLGMLVVYIASCAYMGYKSKNHPEYAWIIAAASISTLSWPLNIFHVFGDYDIGPMTLLLTTACLTIITSKYRMFDTVATAKNQLIDELEDGIIVYDGDERLAYYNIGALLVFPELEKSWPKEEAKEQLEEFLLKNEDGFLRDGRYYQWKRKAMFDGKKRLLGEIIRIVDYTETYEHTNKLLELKNDAEKANRAKSMFLTNMSHEIRTPLNAIVGMDELILRENASESINEYAGNIREAGRVLLALINDVLDISKIESGKLDVKADQYEMSSLLYNVFTMISMKAEEKGLVFRMEIDETLPNCLYGDEMRLKQCLVNLLTNSVKYTKKGKVTFKVSWKPISEEELTLQIAVSDTGIGIKQSDLGRIFDSFERVDYPKNKGIEGSGLGLNITKELVSLMGGCLDVESVYGEGSTFHFEIPQGIPNKLQASAPIGKLKLQNVNNTSPHKSSYIFTAPEARALVVDDNAVNIAVVRGLLKKCNIQTEDALSGPECLDKVSKSHYDIILMDHMMPGMDGIETFKKIRQMKNGKCENVPCIALTANAVAGSKDQYLAAGFTDYLSKPINIDELYRQLMEYLPASMIIRQKEEEE